MKLVLCFNIDFMISMVMFSCLPNPVYFGLMNP